MIKKPVHLLYVPTIFCNMGCQYCYLGELTEARPDERAVSTLQFALDKLLAAGYLPFNLSFHGGEVTTLPTKTLQALFAIAQQHYQTHAESIRQWGFKQNPIHIKTNLLNFSKHYAVLDEYHVSISASIDLPLFLHEQYRVDKNGASTLARMEKNLRLLAQYPHRKKLSCVVTQAHYANIDAFIQDIHYLHNEIGLDMNRFNIMFSFDSTQNQAKFHERAEGLQMLSEAQQVDFYQRLKQAFTGTALETGLRDEWFCEFTPDYCCSAVNCGNKFFLLQYDGNVYSCPRGQSSQQYYYGNLLQEDADTIIQRGWQVIERNENTTTIADECTQCEYIQYCHSGCTFVRTETGLQKSYTCRLQKALYQDNPERYKPMPVEQREPYIRKVLMHNNISRLNTYHPYKTSTITPELVDSKNSLQQIITKDVILTELFSDRLFFMEVDGEHYALASPILKNTHDLEFLNETSRITLGVHQDVWQLAGDDVVNNHLLLMLLRDTPVVYGDEGRTKQEHICDYAVYYPSFLHAAEQHGAYYHYDLTPFVRQQAAFYRAGVRNNLFITTKTLREYHYNKQRKNAFYHIQAINLPFPNFEFYWQGVSV